MRLRWHRSFSYLSHRWGCLSWWWVCSANFLFWPGFIRKTDAVLFISCLAAFLFDLQIVFVLVFLVIVPLCNPAGNLWNLIGEASNSGFSQVNVSQTRILLLSVCYDWLAYVSILWCSEQSIKMPASISEAIETGLLSPPPDEEVYRKIFTCLVTSPITLLVSGHALSLQSDLVTDISIVLSSILSAFLLCALW